MTDPAGSARHSTPQTHLEGIECQVGTQTRRHLPADHTAGVHVDDERAIREGVGEMSTR